MENIFGDGHDLHVKILGEASLLGDSARLGRL